MRRTALSVVMFGVGAALFGAAAVGHPARQVGGEVREGGTLRVGLVGNGGPIEPVFGWPLHANVTCARLFTFADVPRTAIIPEVSAGYPKVSRDGKTYAFTIRKGFRFNTGEQLTAQNFAYAINRTLLMHGGGEPYVAEVVGASAVSAGKEQRAAGVRVDRGRLVVKLAKRVPDFTLRMVHPSFCAIPKNLPVDKEGARAPLPSAGPYYVSRWVPERELVLARNPFYRGRRPHHVDRFVFSLNQNPETIVPRIASGRLDTGDIPAGDHALLARRYGVNRSRYFVKPTAYLVSLILRLDRPLFSRLALRKGVAYAVDRRAIASIAGDATQGVPALAGAHWGSPWDRLATPDVPGFMPGRVYPHSPDFARARKLVGRLPPNTTAVMIAQDREPMASWSQVVQQNLARLGITVSVEKLPPRVFFAKLNTPGEPWDLAIAAFSPDLPDPFYRFNVLYDHPGSVFSQKYPGYVRAARRAAALRGRARYRAYGKLELELVKDIVSDTTLASVNQRTFVSARVGCKVLYPELDLAAVCLKR